MDSSLLEILIIILLILANGVFAMAEISVVSARRAKLQKQAEAGDPRARRALDLAQHPNDFLATVQVGITLVGILAGTFGGATLAEDIGLYLDGVPWIAPHGETVGVAAVVLLITYLSLILGELVPKRLGLNNAEGIAAAMAGPMSRLASLTRPIVRLLGFSTDLVIRLLGVKPSVEPSITPEEINILIAQGRESGIFEATEQEMVESVLRLDERRVGAFLTPRSQIAWLDINDPPDELRRTIAGRPHSRYPVARDSLDHVLGYVRSTDLLSQCLDGQPLDLKALVRPPLVVPEGMRALKLLDIFKRQRTHLALVTDEYGSIQGMVTHNDILEDIAGYIPSAGEPEEPRALRREDGSWLVDGLLHVDDLKDALGLSRLPHEEEQLYQTVGGLVMTCIGDLPEVGESFEWASHRFEVLDMDGNRVDKVLIVPQGARGG